MMYFLAPIVQVANEAAAEPTGIAKLGLHPMNLLLQIATVVILLLILKKFAFGPIVAMLEERRKTIEDGIRLGREMEAEKERLDQQVAKALRKARAEADKVVADAHEEAAEVIKSAEAAAHSKAEAVMKDAHNHITQEAKQTRESLKAEVLGLVAEATEVIIDEKLDPVKDARLIEKALRGASQ